MSETTTDIDNKLKAARTLERTARNSRKYYNQKKDNPEFKQLLADRSRARRLRMKEAKELASLSAPVLDKVDAESFAKVQENTKIGRPRKYE